MKCARDNAGSRLKVAKQEKMNMKDYYLHLSNQLPDTARDALPAARPLLDIFLLFSLLINSYLSGDTISVVNVYVMVVIFPKHCKMNEKWYHYADYARDVTCL